MIKAFRDDLNISSSKNEDDVLLETCMKGNKIYIRQTQEVEETYFSMYTCVLSDLGMDIPLISVEDGILISISIAPLQLHPSSGAFIRVFEISCGGFAVMPNIFHFSSFYGTNGDEKGNMVSISVS